jgi:hypothetical protein
LEPGVHGPREREPEYLRHFRQATDNRKTKRLKRRIQYASNEGYSLHFTRIRHELGPFGTGQDAKMRECVTVDTVDGKEKKYNQFDTTEMTR